MKKELITVQLSDLIPYAKNARKNDATVPDLAEDIKQVGYISPIVVDEKNEILAGHTRLKALQYNGETEAEVMRVTGLTKAQKRKFRLYDNKIGEKSEWDYDILAEELIDLDLGDLTDIIDWGFEPPSPFDFSDEEDPEERESPLPPKERFWEIANFKYYDETRTEGKYNFPTNKATQHWPTGLVGFHDLNDDKSQLVNGIHFYIHDYKFECLWNNPVKYFDRFSRYDCVIAPDFSTYTDMSLAQVIWNLYRNRLLVQMMQDYGLEVIPNIMWGIEETFEFCFDGLPKNSVLAVETVGCNRDKGDRELWHKAMDAAIERLEPTGIFIYGPDIGYDFKDIPTRRLENTNSERFKANSKKRKAPGGR